MTHESIGWLNTDKTSGGCRNFFLKKKGSNFIRGNYNNYGQFGDLAI